MLPQLRHFKHYFSNIMVVSFIGGGNRSTRWKPQTCREALTNLLMLVYIHFDKNLRATQYFFFIFKNERSWTPIAYWLIFHYGIDHGLQFESYVKLIMKSNCWLLQVDKGR